MQIYKPFAGKGEKKNRIEFVLFGVALSMSTNQVQFRALPLREFSYI